MGDSVDCSQGITARLAEMVKQKNPALDSRVVSKLVRTRMFARIRWLNQQRSVIASDQRRTRKQLRQHAASNSWKVIY